MDELKPCPFCGGTPTMHRVQPMGGHHGGGPAYQKIKCSCGAGMECLAGYPDETTEAQAIAAWNRRA